ncbi:hypothetical protein M9H77_02226 [Catharanthus roseus]|uniref:Uncharacterized protein n=1 Tax=Catharanthus roseus TaxID=4058 RepID=A0ACC0C869_CATRO|nr:hypothetical protein M9H77_02226 [Catharanthus roseus]
MKRKQKRSENNENRAKTTKMKAVGKETASTADSRITYNRVSSFSCFGLGGTLILDYEVLGLILDFHACFNLSCLPITFVCNLIVARLEYSQGYLELKKEEQPRVTNWGFIRAID